MGTSLSPVLCETPPTSDPRERTGATQPARARSEGRAAVSHGGGDRRRLKLRVRRSQDLPVDPWRAPPSGFSCAILRITARTSEETTGRPVRRRLFQVQNSRNPLRCLWFAKTAPSDCH
jgi:hypothetical protein